MRTLTSRRSESQVIAPPSGRTRAPALLAAGLALAGGLGAETFDRLQYNHPGLVVDLGVGLWAWPMPMDWDQDGDLDLVVSCPDVPFNGIYLFENPGGAGKMPVFKPPQKIGPGQRNMRVSHGRQPKFETPASFFR